MEKTHPHPTGSIIEGPTMECHARKLGVLGKTIDEKILQGLRSRLSNLLIVDGKDVFELFSAQGKDAKSFFLDPDAFPYYFRLEKEDPNSTNLRYRIVAILDRPALEKSANPKGVR